MKKDKLWKLMWFTLGVTFMVVFTYGLRSEGERKPAIRDISPCEIDRENNVICYCFSQDGGRTAISCVRGR